MQISKLTNSIKLNNCAFASKSFLTAALLFLGTAGAYSQAQNVKGYPMPEMPSISVSAGPSMPSISTPSLGSKFYTPKLNSTYKPKDSAGKSSSQNDLNSRLAGNGTTAANSLNGSKGTSASSVAGGAAGNTGGSKVSVNVPGYQNFSQNSLNGAGNNAGSASYANAASASKNRGISVSAQDVLSMNKKGLISNLYSLTGGSSLLNGGTSYIPENLSGTGSFAGSEYTGGTNGLEYYQSGNYKNDSLVLNTLLSELEALKARQTQLEKELAAKSSTLPPAQGNKNKVGSLKDTQSPLSGAQNASGSKNGYSGNNSTSTTEKTGISQLVGCTQSGATGNPQILRFIVNGTNILDSLRTVWFSRQENDGTFLVTGDRKYYEDSKVREETFYLLFKADGNGGSAMGYNVEGKVMQDYENKNSLLYKIANDTQLKANKTGNLITLSNNSENLKINLLIDSGI